MKVYGAGAAPVKLTLEKTEFGERWIRDFRGEVFASEQRLVRGLIAEKYGVTLGGPRSPGSRLDASGPDSHGFELHRDVDKDELA